MSIRSRTSVVLIASLCAALLTGCVTKMTAKDLGGRLERESLTAGSRQAVRRIVPVHAQTKMEAWILRVEAKSSPEESPVSRALSTGFRLGERQRVDYFVGSPFPELLEQLVMNGLDMNEGRALPGLRIVLVSPEAPSPELRNAATAHRVRLEHRLLN